ncbi:MAG: ABC transporter substrate-binding protein [Rhodopseudomonas sp.]|nr:ABC transporter substrate-binding protein [Rhodopseudomonas sp.]
MNRRRFLTQTALIGSSAIVPWLKYIPAEAATPGNTLVLVAEDGPNGLDPQGAATSRPVFGVAFNVYDRLITHGRKKRPDGSLTYDYSTFEPELAESWTVSPDGKTFTFRLRRDARFHDGTPVTAEDVKWSFDRVVSVGGFPSAQMSSGAMKKPEQFTVVDPHTFRIEIPAKNKLTLPNLTTPVAVIYNSKVAKAHATEKDPWARDYLKITAAGGGAFKVAEWQSGQQIVYARFDGWKSGPRPALERVVMRQVPNAGNRRAMLERGDTDMVYGLNPKDASELAAAGAMKVVGTPIENSMWYLGMNVTKPPFNNVRLRQAIAYAVPYEKIMQIATYGRSRPLFGATKPIDATWPQPFPYKTDMAKAKALLAESGAGGTLSVPFYYNTGAGTLMEPTAILIAESLGRLGIKTTIEKIPGSVWTAKLLEKSMPLYLNTFGGWLNYPEYFFYFCYHGANRLFNTMGYKNPAMDKLIDAAAVETDPAKYADDVKGFVKMAIDDVPRVPLFQEYLEVAMAKSVDGYTYWYHRQFDARPISKSSKV